MNNGMLHSKRVGYEDIKSHLALTLIMLVLILSACGQESNHNEVSVSNDTLSAPLPSALLVVDENNLMLDVVVDGGTPQACANLSVDQVNGTYSCNITLPGGPHTISLIFSIIDAAYGAVPVATTSGINIDVVPGQTTSADFSTVIPNYMDDDGDGIINLVELDEGSNPNTPSYYVGGTVSGLLGSGAVIQVNGGNDLTLTSDGSFKFLPAVADTSTYTVTVLTQPSSPSQTCSITNESGTVSGADVTNIALICAPLEPAPITVTGTSLFCNTGAPPTSTVAANYVAEQADNPPDSDISRDPLNHNSGNNLKRLSTVVLAEMPDGTEAVDDNGVPIGEVHPIIVSYGEQVIGGYEGGDGSADIGDPDNIDDIFTSLSLDNGKTWKKVKVGATAQFSSRIVTWAGLRIPYPGHSHKPTMEIQGNNILLAWNDKYCPNGDPFDLVDNTTGELVDPDQPDYYKVNGSQGSIDYGGIVAPNDKILYEVPFSCVWTARGVFDATDAADGDGILEIQWRESQQLTSGTRDSNKIWIASEDIGFAIAWQEDTAGVLPGTGLGPGEGYTGATTNHGTDIWYTYITKDEFDDVCADADCTATTDVPADIEALGEKPKPAVYFTYPVRITNNETCTPFDTKLYCSDQCISTIVLPGDITEYCIQYDLDYMTPDATIEPKAAVLNGDTGASLPTLKILKTNAATPEFVTILAYEETKGLSEADPSDPDNIALEGKAVYFESFFWDQPVEVSAGRIVNLRVPEAVVAVDGTVTLTGKEIYENARRVDIMNQVDACEMQDGDPTFALIYQQGYAIQGGPSDMFIRVNTGFTYDDFGQLDGRDVTNVSSHDNTDINGTGQVIWDTTWLDTQSYENAFDNTFSPRGWLRGGDVYTGFEYSPLWLATSVGTVPNNFWIHRYVDSVWKGPMQISIVTGEKVSTLDPRFIPTPKARHTTIESDKSNPDVIFLGYGTFYLVDGNELDLYYTRSTDKGATWEYIDGAGNLVITDAGLDGIPGTADDTAERLSKLSAEGQLADSIHEMELQGLAAPDGTMFFGAWLRETPEVCNSPECGMDSRVGTVNYVDPATLP